VAKQDLTQRQEAQFYLERVLRDLALSTGDHYNARSVATQAQLFLNDCPASKGLTASHFYAIASLVERCVFRALNIDTSKTRLENEMSIRRKLEAYEQGPTIDELLAQEQPE
jgi:hypothetical protein